MICSCKNYGMSHKIFLWQKFREMQPLHPEQELIRSAERAKRRQRKEEIKNAKKAVAFLSPLVSCDGKDNTGSGMRAH